jgi:hypothetical protein
MTCAVCLMLGRVADEPIVTIGGYSVCPRHVGPVAAVVGGRDWPAILVICGMDARQAQNNPRPPVIG